jgi:hypothetical protein
VAAAGGDEGILARIDEVCRWYAVQGPPSGRRQATALTELAYLADGRMELLARYAGETLARYGDGPDADACGRAVQLCITAGADMSLIERWSRESSRPGGARTGRRSQP